MRVFLDTNVLASAFATRGLCADLLRAVLERHELVTSEVVLYELERVLQERFGVPEETTRRVLSFLRSHHVEPTPAVLPRLPIRDPDDRPVVASAIAAGADVFVTKDILSVADQLGVRITDPRGVWDLLQKR